MKSPTEGRVTHPLGCGKRRGGRIVSGPTAAFSPGFWSPTCFPLLAVFTKGPW